MKNRSTSSKLRTLALVLTGVMLGGVLIGPVSAAVSFDREDRKFIRKTARKIANKRQKKLRNQLQPQISANAAGIANNAANVAANSGVFASFKNGPAGVPSNLEQIMELVLPPGDFALFSKITIFDTGDDTETYCELRVGTAVVDSGSAEVGVSNFTGDGASTLNLMAAVNAPSGASSTLWCDDNADGDSWELAKIMGIRSLGISNIASTKPVLKGPDPDDR